MHGPLSLLVASAACGLLVTAMALAAPPPRSVSLAGLPYVPDGADAGPADLVDAIRARRAGGKLLNLDRMLLNSPAFAQGWNAMLGTIRGKLALSPRLRELAIMSIGVLNRAEYEWQQHEADFLAAGGTKSQLAALRDPVAALSDSVHFDEAARATLALTYEMTTKIAVSEATMARVRAVLPDAQVVELIGVIAGYNMVSRFVVATGVERE